MKATQEKEADLGNSSIGKLLFKLALPAILAQIINVMYNMVDRMYIGHIADVGPSRRIGQHGRGAQSVHHDGKGR